ncbi:hypothetical protein BDR22DRAFT_438379 [Usnea florida]
MTTNELLQHYPLHNDSNDHGKDPDKARDSHSMQPHHPMSNRDPCQYFDAKTKILHNMLDKVVKDLAGRQPEPASEWAGTLWRSPGQPRSRSPTYSDISDSFDSPTRIEHCINDLLSTPTSAASAEFKGPDGRPLGIEVAMNDFHRGRLSTAVVQEKELPNPLILRKKVACMPLFGGNGNREEQGTASCGSVPFGEHDDSQDPTDIIALGSIALQREQSNVRFQQDGERQGHQDSAGHERLASREQSGDTRPQHVSEEPYRQENLDLDLGLDELQEQMNEEEKASDLGYCIQILSARKYGDAGNSRGYEYASSELHSAVAQREEPIGLALSPGLQPPTSYLYTKEYNGSRFKTDGASLSIQHDRLTALSQLPPHSGKPQDDPPPNYSKINALADALDGKANFSIASAAFKDPGVERISGDIDCQNKLGHSENNTLGGTRPLTSENSEVDADTDITTWTTLGPLEDILEESEEPLADTVTLGQGQPQHFAPEPSQPLELQNPNGTGGTHDSMLCLRETQTKSPNLSFDLRRFPPKLSLTIAPSAKAQYELTQPSTYHCVDSSSSESPAATKTMSKNATQKKGCLSAAAVAELRKIARSQPHFLTAPDSPSDQAQAEVHPLLRSGSSSHSSSQPSKVANDSPLKYMFEDDDNERYKAEGDSFSHLITMKPHSLFQPEAQGIESFVTRLSRRERPSSQFGKITEDTCTASGDRRKADTTAGHEVDHEDNFNAQRSTLRSSNDTTLVPSLESATRSSTSPSMMSRNSAASIEQPDLMQSSILQLPKSISRNGYYADSAIGTSAAYNSWASTPHHHEHGTSSCTPSSAATVLTSIVPTPSTNFYCSSSTSRGMTVTPSSSFGKFTDSEHASRGDLMTPSSSFGQLGGKSPSSCGSSMAPGSSVRNFNNYKAYRRSVSTSNMFARYQKARYPNLPTATITDSMVSSDKSVQAKEFNNDPFTSTHITTTPCNFNLKPPSKENLADKPNTGVNQFNTPTKRSSGRFSLQRRSLSISGRPTKNEGLESALSTMVFSPPRNRLHKRSRSISGSIDTTARPEGSGSGHRRSLSAANVKQKWEMAPPPTPLALRDEFSMRYRPEPLEADDHYFRRRDALQGMKQGLKKVFGRK